MQGFVSMVTLVLRCDLYEDESLVLGKYHVVS